MAHWGHKVQRGLRGKLGLKGSQALKVIKETKEILASRGNKVSRAKLDLKVRRVFKGFWVLMVLKDCKEYKENKVHKVYLARMEPRGLLGNRARKGTLVTQGQRVIQAFRGRQVMYQ